MERTTPAERQETVVDAVCWECGERKECYEYIVCCTGTLFHLCAACEERVQADGASPEACPADGP
jgi:hypothetical protein